MDADGPSMARRAPAARAAGSKRGSRQGAADSPEPVGRPRVQRDAGAAEAGAVAAGAGGVKKSPMLLQPPKDSGQKPKAVGAGSMASPKELIR